MDAVKTERRGALALVTLNRPEVVNAINDDIRVQLPLALRQCDDDPELRVIVLHGAGSRGFCAGTDLDLKAGLLLEKTLFSILSATEDKKEAAAAFREKRRRHGCRPSERGTWSRRHRPPRCRTRRS